MMETPYVDLGRRFRELTKEQAKDPDALDLDPDWEWLGYRSTESWSDLENRFRTSMRAIVVWLAQGGEDFNEAVRRNVIEIEPELLITTGDQEQYSVGDRIRIMDALLVRSGTPNSRSLTYSPASLRRFATSAVADAIRARWGETPQPRSEEAIALVMKQAQALADDWSAH